MNSNRTVSRAVTRRDSLGSREEECAGRTSPTESKNPATQLFPVRARGAAIPPELCQENERFKLTHVRSTLYLPFLGLLRRLFGRATTLTCGMMAWLDQD